MAEQVSPYVWAGLQKGRPTLEQISLAVVEAFLSQHKPEDQFFLYECSQSFFYQTTRHDPMGEGRQNVSERRSWGYWCKKLNISVSGMKGNSRIRPLVAMREMYFDLAWRYHYGVVETATFLKRHHATGIHARKSHDIDVKYPDYQKVYKTARTSLKSTSHEVSTEIHSTAE
jgi:hypothetical protein